MKLKQLFFNVLNTEKEKRIDIDPLFKDIPYLNGSLFIKTKAEERNPDYWIKAEILREVITFLDTFKFVSETEEKEESLNPEILGYIFERAMTAQDRKGTGAYYTPKPITKYICENTIYPYILDRVREYLKEKKGYKEEELPKSIDDILKLRSLTLNDIYFEIVQKIKVLDPACGSGAFLLSACNVLLELYKKIEDRLGLNNSELALKKVILKNSIYGVDINHKAIEIAKLRLWLWVAESYDPERKIEPLPNIEYNIRAGNSLIGFVDISKFREMMFSMDEFLGKEVPLAQLLEERDSLLKSYKFATGKKAEEIREKIEELTEKIKRRLDILLFQELRSKKLDIKAEEFAKLEPFHWGFEFHEVFENEEKGFDIVIGNPPYVRQEKIKKLKPLFKKIFSEVYNGVADLSVYFVKRSIDLTRQKGYHSFIITNKWLRARYGTQLRRYLSKNIKIDKIIDFNGVRVFVGASIDTLIYVFKKSKETENKIW